MQELNVNVRTLFYFLVFTISGFIFGTLCIFGFPSIFLTIGMLAVYCLGFYWLWKERTTVGEFLDLMLCLILWLIRPRLRRLKEGEESPYSASSSELNPLKIKFKMKRRKESCRKLGPLI